MTKKYFYLLFSLAFCTISLMGQTGYNIEVTLDNYDQEKLMLGYHYGDKQYIKDSVKVNAAGKFVFQGTEDLDPGVYLMVMPPDNQYFQVLVDKNEQHFTVTTDAKSPTLNMKVTGSKDNQLFIDYMTFLSKKRPEAEGLKKELTAAVAGDKPSIQAKLDGINTDVKAFQNKIVNDHSNTLTAALVKSGLETPMPEFKGTEKEIQLKRLLSQ